MYWKIGALTAALLVGIGCSGGETPSGGEAPVGGAPGKAGKAKASCTAEILGAAYKEGADVEAFTVVGEPKCASKWARLVVDLGGESFEYAHLRKNEGDWELVEHAKYDRAAGAPPCGKVPAEVCAKL